MGFLASFFKGFIEGILPRSLQEVMESSQKSEPNELEIAKECFRMYGHNPEHPFTDQTTGKPILSDELGYIGWLPPDAIADFANELSRSLSEKVKKD